MVSAYAEQGVSADHLVLGLAFWGVDFTCSNDQFGEQSADSADAGSGSNGLTPAQNSTPVRIHPDNSRITNRRSSNSRNSSQKCAMKPDHEVFARYSGNETWPKDPTILQLLSRSTAGSQWDTTTQAPYFEYYSNSSNGIRTTSTTVGTTISERHVVYYQDAEAIAYRVRNVVVKHGMRGIGGFLGGWIGGGSTGDAIWAALALARQQP
jgi:hypothetical protein